MPINKLLTLSKSQTAKDSLVSFSGQVSAGIFGAIFMALAARVLGKESFGIFSLALATAVIIKDIVDPGLNSVLLRFVPAQKDQKTANAFIRYAWVVKTIYYSVLIPLALIFSRFLSTIIFKRFYQNLIPLTLVLTLALSYAALVSGMFQSKKRFTADAFFTASQPLLRLTFLILLFSFHQISVQSLIIINFTAYFIITAIAIYNLTPQFIYSKLNPSQKSQANKFMAPVMLSTATGTLTDRINLYITNQYTNPAQVGLLAAAIQLFVPTKQIAGSMSNVFGSRFSGLTSDAQAFQYLKKTLFLVIFLALGLVSTGLIANPLISLIFGHEYLPAVTAFRILTLAFGLFLIQVPFSSMLMYYKGRSDILAHLAILQLITTFVTNIYLIPKLGINGAAWAFFVTILISASATMALSLTVKNKHHT